MNFSKKSIALLITAVLTVTGIIVSLAAGAVISNNAVASNITKSLRVSNYTLGNVGLTIRDVSQLPKNSTYSLNGIGGAFPTSAGGVFLEFGEYPRSYVGNSKNAQLEQLFSASLGSEIVETGKSYTNNSFKPHDDKGWVNSTGGYQGRESFEYEHQGKKYVRHQIMRYSDINTSKAHTNAINETTGELYDADSDENSLFKQDTYAWFQVEPIRWLIANWSEMPTSINPNGKTKGAAATMQLLAIDQIMAGVPHQAISNMYPFSEVLWENSRIRTFLNGTTNDESRTGLANAGSAQSPGTVTGNPFIVDAFTAEQRALITTQTIRNGQTPNTVDIDRDITSTEQYNDEHTTEDKIFLLSYRQVFGQGDSLDGSYRSLFDEGIDPSLSRIAANTDWAFGNFAWSNDTTANLEDHEPQEELNLWGAGAWWLRTPYSITRIARVFYNGEEFRCYTYNPSYGIRPAMCLSIENIKYSYDGIDPLIIGSICATGIFLIGSAIAGFVTAYPHIKKTKE